MNKEYKIKQLSELSEISYEEAKYILEKFDYDSVMAFAYINEQSNKNNARKEQNQKYTSYQDIINKIIVPELVIIKDNQDIIVIPLILIVLITIIFTKLTIFILLLSFFFNINYKVNNFFADKTINNIFNEISKFILKIKNIFKFKN